MIAHGARRIKLSKVAFVVETQQGVSLDYCFLEQ